MHIPPIKGFSDYSYDTIVSFQVIEHIKNDEQYLQEIFRLLKKNGTAVITTPNKKMSLSRNPWHIREYLPQELDELCKKHFPEVEVKGITGNEKVTEYYERNKKSVQKIMKWDVFDLQHRLPASWLRTPYEILNRINRKNLYGGKDDLAAKITHGDFMVKDNPENCIDLFVVLRKS